MVLNPNLAHIKNSSSLIFESVNIVLKGKGEFGDARAHEKGHARRGKIQATAQRHVRQPLLWSVDPSFFIEEVAV